ncbi:MAG: tRNA pseudouridine synthase C [Pseudidiomarina mangrovi]|nr:MAG: tRNA pseudouridine synthase C [Pseudidiomarina mangrovi]
MSNLTIVYDDASLVVIDKPAGLLVHRSWIAREATEFALQQLRDQIGQRVYPVHRLDRPTSGLLVFGKDADTARLLSEQFAERQVTKRYHAIVRGYLGDGVLDYPLKEELDKIADKRAKQDKEPQPALTEYRCVQQFELPVAVTDRHPTSRYSLMELWPKTGRKHQLRRHMAHLRHPIIGDTRHGDSRQNRYFRENHKLTRLLLAATGLQFQHPHSGAAINLQVPIPPEFLQPFVAAE